MSEINDTLTRLFEQYNFDYVTMEDDSQIRRYKRDTEYAYSFIYMKWKDDSFVDWVGMQQGFDQFKAKTVHYKLAKLPYCDEYREIRVTKVDSDTQIVEKYEFQESGYYIRHFLKFENRSGDEYMVCYASGEQKSISGAIVIKMIDNDECARVPSSAESIDAIYNKWSDDKQICISPECEYLRTQLQTLDKKSKDLIDQVQKRLWWISPQDKPKPGLISSIFGVNALLVQLQDLSRET